MTDFPRLLGAVQRNCDISDARNAGDYGLCTFLLKMREYYRWENELPFVLGLQKEDLGEWLKAREQLWGGIEDEDFVALPLAPGEVDPFEVEAVNRRLVPHGLVYGAGYGRFHKAMFFLGRLLRIEERAGFTVIVSSCEYARELSAPPAMLQARTIFLRQESVRRYVWEKIDEWQWQRQDGPMAQALAGCDFADGAEAGLERMSDRAMETMLLHEVGEAMAGELLGERWHDVTMSLARTPGESLARAVRDLLADCLSTLPALIARDDPAAVHFYFATFDAPRRQLFPQALAAYEHYSRCGDLKRLEGIVLEGQERWLAAARGLADVDAALRAPALAALLQRGAAGSA